MERVGMAGVGMNPNNPGTGMPNQPGTSGMNIQQPGQPQMQQQIVSQQQGMPIQGMSMGNMSTAYSTMGMTGGTITVTGGTYRDKQSETPRYQKYENRLPSIRSFMNIENRFQTKL